MLARDNRQLKATMTIVLLQAKTKRDLISGGYVQLHQEIFQDYYREDVNCIGIDFLLNNISYPIVK